MDWYAWVALIALFFLDMLWRRVRKPSPVPLDPNKPYEVFCRDYDVEVESEKLDGILLGLDHAWTPKGPLAKSDSRLAAFRARHDFAVLETAARIRSATSQEVLEDTVVSVLVDHSGSMRGQKMLIAASAVMMASDLLDSLRAKQEVLGFTTVRWKGGRSREKWLRSGRPPYPGRLNDVLHIIYCSAGETLQARHLATMLREEFLKENIDGEAIEWAASRLRKHREGRKYMIVVSDGAPVDDSTLLENGERYLENHLRKVIREIARTGDIQLSAIGIEYAVGRYYDRSVTVNTPDDLGNAVLELIEQLFSASRKNA